MNGVILVSWRQEVLERQIDFGAQLGHVVIGLARMELQNFYRNVMPVVEYFDQSGMLSEVNGERNPSEVYIDFRDAVMKILNVPNRNSSMNNSRSLQAEVFDCTMYLYCFNKNLFECQGGSGKTRIPSGSDQRETFENRGQAKKRTSSLHLGYR